MLQSINCLVGIVIFSFSFRIKIIFTNFLNIQRSKIFLEFREINILLDYVYSFKIHKKKINIKIRLIH